MTEARPAIRGRPLTLYAAILVAWASLRIVTWDTPLVEQLAPALTELPELIAGADSRKQDAVAAPERGSVPPALTQDDVWRLPDPLPQVERPLEKPIEPMPPASEMFDKYEAQAGHQMMWLAAMSRLPVPRDVVQTGTSYPLAYSETRNDQPAKRKRWSLDAWILLRESSDGAAQPAGLRPSYGSSQQGAVLRYSLAKKNGRELSAYSRFTRALSGARETDLAAGLVAKPSAKLPLWIHAEMRATRVSGMTDYRPAGFATTQVQKKLPGRLEMRAYAQAGYVGGDFATAFADGQLVTDREVASFDLGTSTSATLRLGAGVWGGAQKGAQRLDFGPSANIVVPVADAPVRLSVDYRLRAAGEADPDSGVAITLSTGF